MIDNSKIPGVWVREHDDGSVGYSASYVAPPEVLNHETFHLFVEAVNTIVDKIVSDANDLKAEVSAHLRKE